MMQVWCYDKNMIFTESIFIDEIAENMTTVSPNGLGLYCKKWDFKNKKWVEGWTEEEIQSWKQSQQIDICPVKTTEQKLGELVTQVSIMDEIIANLTLEVL